MSEAIWRKLDDAGPEEGKTVYITHEALVRVNGEGGPIVRMYQLNNGRRVFDYLDMKTALRFMAPPTGALPWPTVEQPAPKPAPKPSLSPLEKKGASIRARAKALANA